jgi:hypothetical protein
MRSPILTPDVSLSLACLLPFMQGLNLKAIEGRTEARLIVSDTGEVSIYAPTQLAYEHAVAAVQEVEGLSYKAGQVFNVKVRRSWRSQHGESAVAGTAQLCCCAARINQRSLPPLLVYDSSAGMVPRAAMCGVSVQVIRVVDYGAFVEMPNGMPTLLHISELSHTRVRDVHEVLQEGQVGATPLPGVDHWGRGPGALLAGLRCCTGTRKCATTAARAGVFLCRRYSKSCAGGATARA